MESKIIERPLVPRNDDSLDVETFLISISSCSHLFPLRDVVYAIVPIDYTLA